MQNCETCQTPECDNPYMDGECPFKGKQLKDLSIPEKLELMKAMANGNTPAAQED